MHRTPRTHTGETPSLLLTLSAVVLVAGNLRATVSSFGAVLADVQAATGLSAAVAGVITSIPLLCFAGFGALSPMLARRFGLDRVIGGSIALLTAALLVRVAGGVVVLLLGTLLACAGIAVVNVLLPVVVKLRFPRRIGMATGAYSAALATGSALGAGVSAPLAEFAGWQVALAAWALPAAVAAVLWVAMVRRWPSAPRRAARDGAQVAGHASHHERADMRVVLRHPVTWALAIFFGTQATYAYVQMGWVAVVFHDAGFSTSTSGLLVAVSILVGVPVYFVVPSLASRSRDQRLFTSLLTLVSIGSIVGLALAPASGAWLWAVMMGVGGSTFPLVLTMFNLRAATAVDTGALSAFGQGLGYLISAIGPFGFGLLHDKAGNWTVPLFALIVVMAVQLVAGLVAGRDVLVSSARSAGGSRALSA
ncbi:MAG TPA: MFS transporter [Actinomycetales bacterium]|nr:MFS transporter [Actinomycetales bacterium]